MGNTEGAESLGALGRAAAGCGDAAGRCHIRRVGSGRRPGGPAPQYLGPDRGPDVRRTNRAYGDPPPRRRRPGRRRGYETADLYDPATGTFTPTGSMSVARTNATATLLQSGEVLVAGGVDNTGRQVASAELYDPATGTFTPTGSMHTARSGHTADAARRRQGARRRGRLQPPRFCNAGSFLDNLTSAELYNPKTGTWTVTGSMHFEREYFTATLLAERTVLVAGGFASCDDDFCSDNRQAEIYNPTTGTWSITGSMHVAREQFTATLLTDGEVLVGRRPERGWVQRKREDLFRGGALQPRRRGPGPRRARCPSRGSARPRSCCPEPDGCSPPAGRATPPARSSSRHWASGCRRGR